MSQRQSDGAAPPLVLIQDLSHAHGEEQTLRGVSLEVREGEVLGLLGPNGAGKSTLINVLCGLERPSGGRVTVAGHDVAARPRTVRSLIGLVPQEVALYPQLSGRDNLRFFGRLQGMRGGDLEARLAWALDLVELDKRADQQVGHYSGGMQRRLNLAAGLLHRPRLLLLDEPTVGMDPQSRRRLLENLKQVARDGAAVLLATHLMEEAEEICHRVAILDRGALLIQGRPSELVEQLEGGVIHLELDRMPEGFAEAAARLPGVTAASALERPGTMPPVLAVETRGAAEVLPRLVTLAAAQALDVRSLDVLSGNLESVFLHLTGRRPRD